MLHIDPELQKILIPEFTDSEQFGPVLPDWMTDKWLDLYKDNSPVVDGFWMGSTGMLQILIVEFQDGTFSVDKTEDMQDFFRNLYKGNDRKVAMQVWEAEVHEYMSKE